MRAWIRGGDLPLVKHNDIGNEKVGEEGAWHWDNLQEYPEWYIRKMFNVFVVGT